MGAWGYSPLDCDEGLDVKENWDNWLDGFNAVGYDEAIKRFFEHWGNAIKYGDSVTNNEIIALAFIHLENDIELPTKLKKATEDAINRELEGGELERWKEPDKRQAFLEQLLTAIDGARKVPKNPNFLLDPALHYRSLSEAEKKLSKAYGKLKSKRTYPISLTTAGFPTFMETMRRLMSHRIWEKDSKIYMQAIAERSLMLGIYLSIDLNYSQEEADAFLAQIRKRLESF